MKSELRTVALSDSNHLAHVIVLWQIQKFKCYYTVLFCFTLYLKAIFKYKPPGAHIRRGDLTKGFLRYKFGGLIFRGAYIWKSLFSVFYGMFDYRI